MANDPSVTLPAVDEMRKYWAVVDALMGGTSAMRAAGEQFLPKWPKEEKEAYEFRLNGSTLLPAYLETVRNNTGRVFAEPIQLAEDAPPEIVELMEDIDRQGNNLQVWAKSFFELGLSRGMALVLAEFPPTTDEEGRPLYKNKAQEKAAKVRPYAVVIKPSQILGWKAAQSDKESILTQFRYIETVEEEDAENEFNVLQVEQIRVLDVGMWRTYRKTANGKGWELHSQGVTSLGFIPLAVFNPGQTGFMTTVPPLMELAHLNIKHWQSQSDQDNILHVARVPILVSIGVSDGVDETGNPIKWEMTIGSSSAVRIDNPDGDLKYVEHTGAAIKSGAESLTELKDEMRMAGAKLMQKDKQQTKTATQAEEEAAVELSPLETMAGMLEDCIDNLLYFFASFMRLPNGGHCEVRGNFDVDYAPEVNLPLLKSLADASYLSQETLFAECQRRGVISADVNWDEEKQRISEQGPAPGTLGMGDPALAGGA